MIMSALRRGVGCVVTGEPGVGKTIVIRELKRRLDADGRITHLVLATAAARFPRQSIGETASAVPPVLLVDDAHRLDAHSAALVWHLAVTGTALVVATARSGVQAAAGPTDALAAEPGISGRTVSTHLTNVDAKLGVGSRHHLSETL
jgi:hypothetical protein